MIQLNREWGKRSQPRYTIFLLLDHPSEQLAERFRERLIAADRKQIIITDLLRIPLLDFEGQLDSSQFDLLCAFIKSIGDKYNSINFQFTNNFSIENKNVIWHLNMDETFKKIQFDLMSFKWPKYIHHKAYTPQIPLYISLKHEHVVDQQLKEIKKQINIVENHQPHFISIGKFSQFNGVTRAISAYSLKPSAQPAVDIEAEKVPIFCLSSL